VEHALCYCAEDSGVLAGFYALSGRPPALELEHCWVLPAHMGRGVGARLVEHAALTARAVGAARLIIAADPFAEGFYRRMGAKPAGSVPSMPRGRALPRLLLRV
jgi:GNAT superfamily N-acetyltransferase